MADLNLISTTNVSAVFVGQCRIRTVLVGAGGVAQGQPICVGPTTGKVIPASAAASNTSGFRGIALETLFEGQGVDVLERGYVAGYDLSALAFDALVYLSDTPGKLSSTPGTNNVAIGRVVPMSDRDSSGNPSKVLRIEPSLN